MFASQSVFAITDLVKLIGGFKRNIEENENIEYFTSLLLQLNKLHIKYVKTCWRPSILHNKITDKQKRKIKQRMVELLREIEQICDAHLFTYEQKYRVQINQLYNVVFMDMNNLTSELKDVIENNPHIEMGPLFFMTYKYTPELNHKLNDYRLHY